MRACVYILYYMNVCMYKYMESYLECGPFCDSECGPTFVSDCGPSCKSLCRRHGRLLIINYVRAHSANNSFERSLSGASISLVDRDFCMYVCMYVCMLLCRSRMNIFIMSAHA